MNVTQSSSLEWRRGSRKIVWGKNRLTAPGPVLWACELPTSDGIAVVTLFDEGTSPAEPNAYVYRMQGRYTPVRIAECGHLVRFLGCHSERGMLVLNAANSTEYLLDPQSLVVQGSRYYR